MCAAIGVDPLAGSSAAGGKEGGGSFWAQMLGGSVNDFYFELAVRVVEVCGATREENGGLIGVKEVRDRIMSTRMEGGAEITEYAFPSHPLMLDMDRTDKSTGNHPGQFNRACHSWYKTHGHVAEDELFVIDELDDSGRLLLRLCPTLISSNITINDSILES